MDGVLPQRMDGAGHMDVSQLISAPGEISVRSGLMA